MIVNDEKVNKNSYLIGKGKFRIFIYNGNHD